MLGGAGSGNRTRHQSPFGVATGRCYTPGVTIVEILGIASGLSLLAGWRLYATVFFTGLAQRFDLWTLPPPMEALHVLTSPWVLAVSGVGFLAEFFADKIPWLDSLWDAVHTLIRPLGGALIALAVVREQTPEWQVIAFLLGGGAALLSHGVKTGTRAAINLSPEPVSNIAASTTEDAMTAGGLWFVLAHPQWALAASAGLLLLFAVLVWKLARFIRRRLKRRK